MTVGPPSSKRQRTDDNGFEENTHSPLIWYDDGSIVLHAETTYFRCHRSILAEHSIIFKDMFQLGDESTEQERVEGCPIVRLTDKAEDVAHFLRAIYDGRNHAAAVSLPFATVAAMLRLGKKYEVQYLKDDAILRLSALFPSTFEDFQTILLKAPGVSGPFINEDRANVIETINLAAETGLFRILPSAFACAAFTLNIDETYGVPRKDEIKTSTLSPAGHKILITGVFKARVDVCTFSRSWLSEKGDPDECSQAIRCSAVKHNMLTWFNLKTNMQTLLPRPWDLHRFFWNRPMQSLLCQKCAATALDRYDAGWKTLWEKMPSYFGFSPWSELQND